MNIYHKSERHFCKQFEAKAVKEKHLQYKDIDACKTLWYKNEDGEVYKEVKTYSIKYQSLANEFDCFSFENKLINSRTGEIRCGNFPNCAATYVVITDGDNWHFYEREKLHAWMKENVHKYERKRLTYSAILNNRKQGRTFDDAENIIVPRKDIEHLLIKKVKHMKRFAKTYKLSDQKF